MTVQLGVQWARKVRILHICDEITVVSVRKCIDGQTLMSRSANGTVFMWIANFFNVRVLLLLHSLDILAYVKKILYVSASESSHAGLEFSSALTSTNVHVNVVIKFCAIGI